MNPDDLVHLYPELHHMAEGGSWSNIRRIGLRTTRPPCLRRKARVAGRWPVPRSQVLSSRYLSRGAHWREVGQDAACRRWFGCRQATLLAVRMLLMRFWGTAVKVRRAWSGLWPAIGAGHLSSRPASRAES